MTALPLEPYADPTPARTPLRLVAGPAGDRFGARRRAADTPVGRIAGRPLRLTRRFRLARTFAIVFLLAASGFAVQAWMNAPGPLEADHATVVQSGQTLSDIAEEQMPGVPVARAVSRITELNSLSSPEVPAGRTVLVPAA